MAMKSNRNVAYMKKRDCQGFTLLEILISISLFSFILTALYSVLSMSDKAISGNDDYMLRLQAAREVLNTMRMEIESTFYKPAGNITRFKVIDRDEYGLQRSSLHFTTIGGPGAGLRDVSYFIENDSGKAVLKKKISRVFLDSEPVEVDVLEEVEEFSIDMLKKAGSVKTWDTKLTNEIPDSLKITLTFLLKGKSLTLYESVFPKIDDR